MLIGLITPGVNRPGKRSAGNPHAAFEWAGAGNGGDGPLDRDTRPKGEKRPEIARPTRPPRQPSTLPPSPGSTHGTTPPK
jgi:hypothetical protein